MLRGGSDDVLGKAALLAIEIYVLDIYRLVAHDTTGYCIISEANNTCYVSVNLDDQSKRG